MRVRVDVAKFKRQLAGAMNVDERMLLEMGDLARQQIETRTHEQRVDKYGKAFEPYSTTPLYVPLKTHGNMMAPKGGEKTPRTKAASKALDTRSGSFTFSAKTGKVGKHKGSSMYFPGGYAQYHAGIQSGAPNLTNTGAMLNALKYRVDRAAKRVFLYFRDARNPSADTKAQGHVFGNGHTPERDFFGVGLIRSEAERFRQLWESHMAKKFKGAGNE